jgi:HSP20 family protein
MTISRTVGLPQGVSEEEIKATYEHGVLEVRAPKPEQPKPKRIEIAVEGIEPTIEGSAT